MFLVLGCGFMENNGHPKTPGFRRYWMFYNFSMKHIGRHHPRQWSSSIRTEDMLVSKLVVPYYTIWFDYLHFTDIRWREQTYPADIRSVSQTRRHLHVNHRNPTHLSDNILSGDSQGPSAQWGVRFGGGPRKCGACETLSSYAPERCGPVWRGASSPGLCYCGQSRTGGKVYPKSLTPPRRRGPNNCKLKGEPRQGWWLSDMSFVSSRLVLSFLQTQWLNLNWPNPAWWMKSEGGFVNNLLDKWSTKLIEKLLTYIFQ